MAQAESALKSMLLYYVVIFTISVLFSAGTVWKYRHDAEKMDKRVPFILGSGFVAILLLVVGVIPVSRDYVGHNIIQADGIIYTNREAGHSGSISSTMGLYSVTLTADGKDLSLITVPYHTKIFVGGTYHVTAYYAPISETLLHIEIIDEAEPVPSEITGETNSQR